MAKIDPYVETPNDRQTPQPVSGGIDTSDIDCMRQGVSIRNNAHRYCGLQPKLWAGTLDHALPKQVFGIPGVYSDGDPFDDGQIHYTLSGVVNHIASGVVSASVIFANAGDDDGDIESFDGVIEALEIRKQVFNPATAENVHRVRAVLQEGNIDLAGRSEKVRQETNCDPAPIVEPYFERGRATALVPLGSYLSDSPLTSGTTVFRAIPQINDLEVEKLLPPFDETKAINPRLPAEYIASGSGREHFAAVLSMLSSSTEVEALKRCNSATAGHVYHHSPFGTDSIAFGGLIRYGTGDAGI